MTRSHGGLSPRGQRPTALQIHRQHDRRTNHNNLHPPSSLPLRPVPPRLPDQRFGNSERLHPRSSQALQLRRRSPDRDYQRRHDRARPRDHNDCREVERYSDRGQQGMTPLGQIQNFMNRRNSLQLQGPIEGYPRFQSTTGLELVRRREDERRLADSSRDLAVLRSGDLQPLLPSGLSQRFYELQRAAMHEQNRTHELTRLNAVMVQRNNTISEGQLKIAEQEEELRKLRKMLKSKNEALKGRAEALDNRTEMAVALHEICNRQQDFLKEAAGSLYPPGGSQMLQFEAWVQSNGLYMAHAKEKLSAGKKWEDMTQKANSKAAEDIGKLAHLAAQYVAQQNGQHSQPTPLAVHQSNEQAPNDGFDDALQQLINDVVSDSAAGTIKEDMAR
ncbi:hypothetical protein SLS57_001304 [Botryosphaeria dothidea]